MQQLPIPWVHDMLMQKVSYKKRHEMGMEIGDDLPKQSPEIYAYLTAISLCFNTLSLRDWYVIYFIKIDLRGILLELVHAKIGFAVGYNLISNGNSSLIFQLPTLGDVMGDATLIFQV